LSNFHFYHIKAKQKTDNPNKIAKNSELFQLWPVGTLLKIRWLLIIKLLRVRV